MRPFLLLLAVIVLTLICGALLAYPAHLLLEPVAQLPFHKVVSRLTSLLALVFVFIYLRSQHTLDLTTAGFAGDRNTCPRQFMVGLFTGLLMLLFLEAVFQLLGIHQWDTEVQLDLKRVILILITAILAGLMAGLLEETIYRGALLGGLHRHLNASAAIIISSLLYAAVHFIKFRALPADTTITWLTAPAMLPEAFFRFADPAIFDGFLSLFVFGALLALIRLHDGNIFRCIGLHTGVVMAIKIINDLTDYVPDNAFDYLVNRYDHILGHLTTAWLSLLVVIYWIYARKRVNLP